MDTNDIFAREGGVRLVTPDDNARPLKLIGRVESPLFINIDRGPTIHLHQYMYRLEDDETGEVFILGTFCRLDYGGDVYEGNLTYCQRVLERRLAEAPLSEPAQALIGAFLNKAHGGADGQQDVDQPGAAHGRRGAGQRGDGRPPDSRPGG
jgi:hypothetical protein